ncbi:hypothetical protein H0H93_011015 [Arthromyces matolae]|nr:hypothetical protein H0H93_011015 [Arthromyces matolae]
MDIRIQRILGHVKPETLDHFKKWIHMPRVLATHHEFSAENALEWVPRQAYSEYIRHMIGQSAQRVVTSQTSDESLSSKSDAGTITTSKPSKSIEMSSDGANTAANDTLTAPNYIEISSESDTSPVKVIRKGKHVIVDATPKPITYIVISSDESDASPPKARPSLKRNYPIRINRGPKKYVEISSDDSEGEAEVVETVKRLKTIT